MSEWAIEVLSRMHRLGITERQLAREVGVSNSYLSGLLHDKRGKALTMRQYILDTLSRMENNAE